MSPEVALTVTHPQVADRASVARYVLSPALNTTDFDSVNIADRAQFTRNFAKQGRDSTPGFREENVMGSK
jgi:hypothetical protein